MCPQKSATFFPQKWGRGIKGCLEVFEKNHLFLWSLASLSHRSCIVTEKLSMIKYGGAYPFSHMTPALRSPCHLTHPAHFWLPILPSFHLWCEECEENDEKWRKRVDNHRSVSGRFVNYINVSTGLNGKKWLILWKIVIYKSEFAGIIKGWRN